MTSRQLIALVVGVAVGTAIAMLVPEAWIVAPPGDPHAGQSDEIWACPMLCVKRTEPGRCPVCGMELERIEDQGDQLILDRVQAKRIGLETAKVERRPLNRHIRTVGAVDYNERHVKRISAWVGGRIDRLYADHTFVDVRAGDHVMQLYSPQLFSAQREHLEAVGQQRQLTRRKLELLGMNAAQIDALESRGTANEQVDINSPISGQVIKLQAAEGQYVEVGDPLYVVADTSTLWLRLDAYEQDLPWIAVGQHVEARLTAMPGHTFPGTVSLVEGIVDSRTRTVKVRLTIDNAAGLLKPGMFAEVTISAALGADGRAVRPSLEGRYHCYMHPDQRSAEPGTCSQCGMRLELDVGAAKHAGNSPPILAVPRSAVLATGERQLVYVEAKSNVFEPRVVRVGTRSGTWLHVLSGLAEGDVVVTHGHFLMDSQMQLTGRPSLLNTTPSAPPAASGHSH